MKFSASDGSSIVEEIRFNTGTDTSSYPIADITRSVNRWYHKVLTWIIMSVKDWQFDDSNNTDLPIATTTMVNGQRDYALPSTLLQVESVEVLGNDGSWSIVQPIDRNENPGISMDNEFSTNGKPEFYDVVGTSILLYPSPATGTVTMTNGLKIFFSRNISEFVTTDTTKEPGFAAPFHRVLSEGASYDFFKVQGDTDRMSTSRQEISQIQKELMDFYSSRHKNKKIGFKTTKVNFR